MPEPSSQCWWFGAVCCSHFGCSVWYLLSRLQCWKSHTLFLLQRLAVCKIDFLNRATTGEGVLCSKITFKINPILSVKPLTIALANEPHLCQWHCLSPAGSSAWKYRGVRQSCSNRLGNIFQSSMYGLKINPTSLIEKRLTNWALNKLSKRVFLCQLKKNKI